MTAGQVIGSHCAFRALWEEGLQAAAAAEYALISGAHVGSVRRQRVLYRYCLLSFATTQTSDDAPNTLANG